MAMSEHYRLRQLGEPPRAQRYLDGLSGSHRVDGLSGSHRVIGSAGSPVHDLGAYRGTSPHFTRPSTFGASTPLGPAGQQVAHILSGGGGITSSVKSDRNSENVPLSFLPTHYRLAARQNGQNRSTSPSKPNSPLGAMHGLHPNLVTRDQKVSTSYNALPSRSSIGSSLPRTSPVLDRLGSPHLDKLGSSTRMSIGLDRPILPNSRIASRSPLRKHIPVPPHPV